MSTQTEIGTKVAPRDSTSVQRPADLPDVGALMEKALSHGMEGVEALEKLVDMQMMMLDRQAESGLTVALAEFKADCPTIPKTKRVKYATKGGKMVDFHFAPLEVIQKKVDPILHRFGLSYTFDTEDQGDKILIRGLLQHVDGAQRESSMSLPISGMQDSPAQRYAGTVSYGKRYVLAALLGLTIEDDVDGQQPGRPDEPIDAEELAEIEELIEASGADARAFCGYLGVDALAKLPASRFAEARRALNAKLKAAKKADA